MEAKYCRDCDHCRENVFGSDKCYKHGMKFVCEIENCVHKVVNETVSVNLDELHGLEFDIRMIREGNASAEGSGVCIVRDSVFATARDYH